MPDTPSPDQDRESASARESGDSRAREPSDVAAGLPADLDALRRDIDAADLEMHRQLIHRGAVIERLIAAKRLAAGSGGAFRPDREADMMRRIAARHEGRLPLSTVEHIWREIIGTFTQLQSPYRVLAARAADPAMRDLLRYYFGFSSPLVEAATNRDAVAAVARSGADLAVVALDDPLHERWWRAGAAAEGTTGARVIAVLPFLPLSGGLDLPRALVIGPGNVVAPDEMHLYAVEGAGEAAGTLLARAGDTALVAAPLGPEDFATAAAAVQAPEWLGSFARPPDWT